MKRITALLTAAAMSVCAASALTAGAADESTYIPTLYFKAFDTDCISTLPSGQTVYINVNDLGGKTELDGQIGVYIDDELQRTGQIIARWVWEGGAVELTGVSKPDEAGMPAPYYASASSYGISTLFTPDTHTMGVNYQTSTNTMPLVPTGTSSDDYPLAVFDYSADTSEAAGRYEIAFKTESRGYSSFLTNLSYRLSNGESRDIKPDGDNAKSIFITINDRPLGDIDNNQVVDGIDASAALTAYAKQSVQLDSGLSNEGSLAADVDGDGVVTGIDASYILSYYAYLSVHGDMSFVDFMNSKNQ